MDEKYLIIIISWIISILIVLIVFLAPNPFNTIGSFFLGGLLMAGVYWLVEKIYG